MKLSENATGVYIIAATPFDDAGAIDEASTDRLVDFYLDCGVQGLTVLGIMGEGQKLTTDESHGIVRRVIRRCAGRVPVVVGVSQPGLVTMAALAHHVMDLGAAGVMLAPPPGLRSDDDVYAYFTAAFDELGPDVPVCLQDFPQGNGVYIAVSVIARLVREQPQLVMIKHEDWPGLGKLSRLRRECDVIRRCSVLTGNGGLYLPQELSRGADGAMTGFAYPEMLVEVCDRHGRGAVESAEDLFDIFLPLVRYEQQPGFGLAVRKEVLRRRGVIACAQTRRPGPRLTADDHAELGRLLDRLERRLSQVEAWRPLRLPEAVPSA